MKSNKLVSNLMTALLVIAVIGCLTLLTVSVERSPQASTVKATQADAAGRDLLQQFSQAFEGAAAQVSPSVVPIFSEQPAETGQPFASPESRDYFGDEFFKRFFSPRQESRKNVVRAFGSGVIVSEDGYILTNNHVVSHAEKITVVLPDKKKYLAEIVGTDPQTDVAVIKIDAHGLPAARLGDSEDVAIGQWVIAVGNPFQLLNTVTTGIISATGRTSIGLTSYENFIQTDASINPGNSGGALADLDGNVIGINTAISSPSGGNVGIGFAIPISMARQVMEQLIADGKVTRGFLGLVPQDIDESLAEALELETTTGSLVGDVTPDGPADRAGIRRGDVITRFDGETVKTSNELRHVVARSRPGSGIAVQLFRDGKRKNVTVELAERPTEIAGNRSPGKTDQEAARKLGITIEPLTEQLASGLGYDGQQGVIVSSVEPGSAADPLLRRGDLLKEINRTPINGIDDFHRATSDLDQGDHVALLIQRGANTFFVGLEAAA